LFLGKSVAFSRAESQPAGIDPPGPGKEMALTSENGWVFSDEDLRGWLAEAGFRDLAVQPLGPPMPHSLASARK
jgi:hypothetical protein